MTHSARLNEHGRMLRLHGIGPYLRAYRPGIPENVVDVLVRAARRDGPADSLLDLGTGTGLMVRALHPYFRDIIAVDPVEDLLVEAERDLRPRLDAGTELRLVHSGAEDYTAPDGWTASLVTICRAFHWMEHALVLDRLARVVPATGVVAIVSDSGFWGADNAWKQSVKAVIHDFLGPDRRPARESFSHGYELFSDILRASVFADVEKVILPIQRTWTTESILGFVYSHSFSARAVFGDRVDEFEGAVGQALAGHSADDTFIEHDECVLWLARKKPQKISGGSSPG
jgi:ubiquinone/menaquinone biosynthesis C-methylase UbiE